MATPNPKAVLAYGKVGLFFGIETFTYTPEQWTQAATFCRDHHIDFVLVKAFDADSDWNIGFIPYNTFKSVGIGVIPYGFMGTAGGYSYNLDAYLPTAITFCQKYMEMYGIVCADIEGDGWINRPDLGRLIANGLANTAGLFTVSSPANFVEAGDEPSFVPMYPIVSMWLPMAYNDYLISTYPTEYDSNYCAPTFDLSGEFGSNNLSNAVSNAISIGLKQISFWYSGFAQQNTTLLDQLVTQFKGVDPVGVPQGWNDAVVNGLPTLTAPNGKTVIQGFRVYVLNNNWNLKNVPLENVEAANPVEEYNSSNQRGGTRQMFLDNELGWNSTMGVYEVPVGQELLGCRTERNYLKGLVDQLRLQIVAQQNQIVALQSQEQQQTSNDIATALSDLAKVRDDLAPPAPGPVTLTNSLGEKVQI